MLKKVTHFTRPTPARQDAPFPGQRFRIAQILTVPVEILGERKCWTAFLSILQ
jgi:hypothetical protein